MRRADGSPAGRAARALRLARAVGVAVAWASFAATPARAADPPPSTQAAWATAQSGGAGAAAVGAVSVRDDRDRIVTLARPARRIVSLAPHATEMLFALGAGERVVAVDRSSDHPPEARRRPALAALPRPDPERLAALSPDLVVLWGPGAGGDLADRIAALGPAVYVSDPRSLEAVATTLERLGVLAGAAPAARAQAAGLRERIAALRARHAHGPAVPVFVQVWSRPLMTLSDRDAIGDALRACGARNVFGGLSTAAAQVDPEAVVRRAPRLVLAFDGDEGRNVWRRVGLLAPQGKAEWLRVDPVLQRPAPRALDELERACDAIARRREG